MKINSQELLLINNKKLRLNEVKGQTSPVTEPQESKPDSTLSALDLQGRNNVAFQGAMMDGARKLALATMMALAVAGGSMVTTGCTDVTQEVEVQIDESLVQRLIDAMKEGDEKQNAILSQILDAIREGNDISREMKTLLVDVLAGINKLDKNDQAGLELMNEVLAVINEYIVQEKEMDEATQALLKSIIENQNSFSAQQKEMLEVLIAKLDTIDTNLQDSFATLFEKLDKMGEDAETIANQILTAVLTSNELDAAEVNLLTVLISQVAGLDENDKVGLELINTIWEKVEAYINDDKEVDDKELVLLQSILENIQNFNGDTKELLLSVIDKIDALGQNATELLDKIYNALDKNNVISSENQELLNQVVAALLVLDENDQKGFELLNDIWTKIETAIAENKALDEKQVALLQSILDNIQNFNADTKDLFAKLINKVDSMDADVIKALKIIIEKMDNIEGTNSEKVLNQILDAINKNSEISADNNKLLSVIITQLAGLDKNDQKGFELINKIWAQLQESIKYSEALDGKTHELLHAILDSIKDLKDGSKDALAKILNAIDKNSDIAQGTQNLVKELLGKVDKLGDKADKIIETIANIGVGEKVDLSKIEDMLADLLAQEKANGQVFNNLDSKLGLIEVTLEALKKHEMGTDPEVLKKLQAILDKIPAGCDCTHESLDITVIIEKLQDIIDKMDDNKNEGILGDLGNLDNILG